MTNVPEERTSEEIQSAIKMDGDAVRGHLDELVRSTVEETLNNLLDAEADQLCGAKRYERSADRIDTRAGSYNRDLETKAGKVSLKVPRLRSLPFETQIIERYKRRESSVEEALVEMYLAGVSVRRVEDITEALWGTRVSSSTVSELNQKIYERIEAWRTRPIEDECVYVYLDGIWLKRSWGGEVKNIAVLVAIGVATDGHRRILGVCEGTKEDTESWRSFLRHLKERGLKGIEMITSDKCLGLVEALGEFYPEASWQRCTVHFYRNVLKDVPRGKSKHVAAMLKAVHAQEDVEAAREKAEAVTAKLRSMRLAAAAKCFEDGVEETLSYMAFPREHWTRIRSNNMLERIMKLPANLSTATPGSACFKANAICSLVNRDFFMIFSSQMKVRFYPDSLSSNGTVFWLQINSSPAPQTRTVGIKTSLESADSLPQSAAMAR